MRTEAVDTKEPSETNGKLAGNHDDKQLARLHGEFVKLQRWDALWRNTGVQ